MASVITMPKPTVTFGELMLRLAPPGFERFLQTPRFDATFGGGEANVAVALASFGLPAAYVTALPETPIGDAAVAELRRFGVDTSKIIRRKGRIGSSALAGFGPQGAGERADSLLRPQLPQEPVEVGPQVQRRYARAGSVRRYRDRQRGGRSDGARHPGRRGRAFGSARSGTVRK